jgi:hypothetical protein
MTSWAQFEAFLKAEAAKAAAAINAAARFFKPMVVAGAEELAKAALASVLEQAPKVISGEEKLNAATSSVLTGLASQGKSIGLSIATAAVQAAYNQVSVQLHPPAQP